MARKSISNEPAGRRPLILRRADQQTVVILVAVLMAMLVGHWVFGILIRKQLIEIDRAPRVTLEFRIPINEVDWPDLTLLPGIGRTLAQRIVDDRTRNGPYQKIEQLERVNGIGPKTIRRIRRYVQVP